MIEQRDLDYRSYCELGGLKYVNSGWSIVKHFNIFVIQFLYLSSFSQARGVGRKGTVSWLQAIEGEAIQNVQRQQSDHSETHRS